MSTPATPERPRQRRRRLTVASVATAVLLAGGGGAYWGSNAAEPAGGEQASAGRTDPPPLVLDGLGRTKSAGSPERGIAPGEPNPNGSHYEADGELPQGPGAAAIRRPEAGITKAEVAAVAEALGVSGTPQRHDGHWRVGGPKDGSGPVLTVGDGRGGASWSYVRYRPTGDDLCGKPKEGSRTPTTPCLGGTARGGAPGSAGGPVSAKEAKTAVRPVLEALELEDAKLDASSTHGSLRIVNARPQAGGLPVYDWTSSFTVNAAGTTVRGHGRLGDLVKGTEYPVMTAGETLEALNERRGGQPQVPSCDDGPPAERKDGEASIEGYPKADDVLTCAPGGGAGRPAATVTAATFGLATRYSEGEAVLVPAWIFEVRRSSGSGTYEVTFPAVEPEFVRTAGGNAGDRDGGGTDGGGDPSGSRALISYTVEGRKLTLTFWGGVCHEYRARAEAAGEKVKIKVVPKNPDPNEVCIKIAKKQQVTVSLDKPLDGRQVVDAGSGEPLSRKKG